MRFNLQLGALLTLITLGGALAGTAYTRDNARVVDYACPSGERFRVEYLGDHVRLRTGSGIFALRHEQVSDNRYSDGQTILSSGPGVVTLERPGLPQATGCIAQTHL